jgi:hypothetical protein
VTLLPGWPWARARNYSIYLIDGSVNKAHGDGSLIIGPLGSPSLNSTRQVFRMVDSAKKADSFKHLVQTCLHSASGQNEKLARWSELSIRMARDPIPFARSFRRRTNTVYKNNNHQNLRRSSRSGFAHLLSPFQRSRLCSSSSGPKRIHGARQMLS